ncbi:MAG: ABC transporter ATP-binding protein [Candidatus Dormibacteraeota bacterium]|nr:ABC transporter ATP-binding protein [Candidatus Dormibacteraeota bacterium]
MPTSVRGAGRVPHETSLRLEGVTRRFHRAAGGVVDAVSAVDLVIEPHEFVCLVGPSGCGKSTLLQLASGLLSCTEGRVLLGETPVTGPTSELGLVFQRDSVFPWMRVIDNVTYGLKCRGTGKRERLEIARSFLREVGLGHVERSWPRELSGGMLKRVAVATVFANSPDVLLLDEPFGALDYVTKLQLHQVLLQLWVETRPTVLFVTHDVDEALMLADRILVMKDGAIVDARSIGVARPRTVESLQTPEITEHKAALLEHLGLEELVQHRPHAVAGGARS